MNTMQQQCFMAAAECMNFTRAAEKLYITQPALSRNIASLEDELGILLFVRHNNVLQITPGGQLFYEWLRNAEPDFSAVLDAARLANSGSTQALHIGFVKSELPSQDVAMALQRLHAAEPDIECVISHHLAQDIISRLEEHTLDVAIMLDSAAHGQSRLVTQQLTSFQRCIAVSIAHPLAGRNCASLADFSEDTFISVKPQVSPTISPMLRRVCRMAGFSPKIIEVKDTDEQSAWIASGRGIGLLIDNHRDRRNPLFSFIELEEDLPVELVCVWDRLNNNPHIPKFVETFHT